ncbi:MAG: zinc ribbon domain-containing protein [Gemmatimonadota bacterium]|jgi:putative FmdB family regulatory protein
MPIYDFVCPDCRHRFEEWVRKADTVPACPECGAEGAQRQISTPRVHSSTTHENALKAARRRDAAQGKERMHAQRQYELNHDD